MDARSLVEGIQIKRWVPDLRDSESGSFCGQAVIDRATFKPHIICLSYIFGHGGCRATSRAKRATSGARSVIWVYLVDTGMLHQPSYTCPDKRTQLLSQPDVGTVDSGQPSSGFQAAICAHVLSTIVIFVGFLNGFVYLIRLSRLCSSWIAGLTLPFLSFVVHLCWRLYMFIMEDFLVTRH